MANFNAHTSCWELLIIIGCIHYGMASYDITVLVNESVILSCSVNASIDIQWHHDPGYKFVYAGKILRYPYNNRFRLNITNYATTATYNLTIPDAKLNESGSYHCSEEISGQRISSIRLTVLHSRPVCNTNTTSDDFVGPNTCNIPQENMTFSCAVSFSGEPPQLIWRSANESQTLNSSVCENDSKGIKCYLKLRPDPLFDGAAFICQTAQSSQYNCSTEVVKVLYFYPSFNATEKKVNEKVICTAKSNLNTTYNWTLNRDNQDSFVSTNQTISLEKAGLYQCEMEYTIRNIVCTDLGAHVTVSAKSTENIDVKKEQGMLHIILQFVFFSVVLPVVITGSIFYYYIRKKNQQIINLQEDKAIQYFDGYLNIVLPNFTGRLTEAVKQLQQDWKPYTLEKMLIIVPDSCYFPDTMAIAGKIEFTRVKVELSEDRAGNVLRNFDVSLYKIINGDQYFYFAGESPATLKTAHNTFKSKYPDTTKAPLSELYEVRDIFHSKLENILSQSTECKDQFELVKWNDLKEDEKDLHQFLLKVIEDIKKNGGKQPVSNKPRRWLDLFPFGDLWAKISYNKVPTQ